MHEKDSVSIVYIVLAAHLDTNPVFCITQFGLKELPKCKQKGFHNHKTEDRKLYREAKHEIDDETTRTHVVDLRVL